MLQLETSPFLFVLNITAAAGLLVRAIRAVRTGFERRLTADFFEKLCKPKFLRKIWKKVPPSRVSENHVCEIAISQGNILSMCLFPPEY